MDEIKLNSLLKEQTSFNNDCLKVLSATSKNLCGFLEDLGNELQVADEFDDLLKKFEQESENIRKYVDSMHQEFSEINAGK